MLVCIHLEWVYEAICLASRGVVVVLGGGGGGLIVAVLGRNERVEGMTGQQLVITKLSTNGRVTESTKMS
jgi:hypothetical protein